MTGLRLLWVRANNTKTGAIPAAYVGATVEEAWKSCQGCSLRDSRKCYAWTGTNRMIFKGQHVERFAEDPGRFSLAAVLARVKGAKAARLGVLGDPSRASRMSVKVSIAVLRFLRLAVLAYTHFWREAANQDLRGDFMASCDTVEEADEALALGWRPATILPWDHVAKTFTTPAGAPGVVCPAQTKDAVTCNSCRMCDPRHPVWAAGKVKAIGFINHGVQARAMNAREAKDQLPLFRGDGMKRLNPEAATALAAWPKVAEVALGFHAVAREFREAEDPVEDPAALRERMNRAARRLDESCRVHVGPEFASRLARDLRAADPDAIKLFVKDHPKEEPMKEAKTPPVAASNVRRINEKCACGEVFTWKPAFVSHRKFCKGSATANEAASKARAKAARPKLVATPLVREVAASARLDGETIVSATTALATTKVAKVGVVEATEDTREDAFLDARSHDAICAPCRDAKLLEDRCAIGMAFLRRWARIENAS